MSYNLSLVSNSSGYLNFVQLLNTNVLNDGLGILILIIIFCITIISFITGGFEMKKSLIGSSFLTLLSAMLLVIVELLKTEQMIYIFVLFLFAMGWSVLKV